MAAKRIIIVEDSQSLSSLYSAYLNKAGMGYDVIVCGTGAAAIEQIELQTPDLLFLDLHLPDISGMEILQLIANHESSHTAVVVITADNSVNTAVEAIQLGAVDFLVKPIDADRLRTTAFNILKQVQLQSLVDELTVDNGSGQFHQLIGQSMAMQAVYRIISSAAPSKASVFISGESGTGKELCANAIHQSSDRVKAPFVAINCAAIPKDLIESEIFGHLKGAFTGAVSDRVGAASQANGGTLFLDEICEMDMSLQSKLLRFIQTGSIQRVGSEKLEKVDVRFVCATNRNVLAEVEAGRFREDLYYRLHVIPIDMPSLHARGNDITLLANHFLQRINREEGKKFGQFDLDALDTMQRYNWPGNVRQLENTIRNAIVLNSGQVLSADMLPQLPKTEAGKASRIALVDSASQHTIAAIPASNSEFKLQPLATHERYYIEWAISQCNGSVTGAAKALSVSPSTLYRKLQSWQEDDAKAASV